MNPNKDQPALWRSSTWLIIFTATLGLFTENFLYGFIVPIMPHMFEVRLRQDPKYTQRYTSAMLFILGAISVPCAPLIGHLADKIPKRKTPLLISLAGCVVGSVLVAGTWSVWSVFLGRLFTGIAGSGAWIISCAMLTDNIDKKHYGKALGFTSSFVTGGVLTGPAVAGTLLEFFGYWPAWSAPFALLVICLIARIVMVETEKATNAQEHAPKAHIDGATASDEHTSLLDVEDSTPTQETSADTKMQTQRNFYRVMLSNASVLAACFNVLVFTLIIAAFDTTLPLHLRGTFGWGPAPTGLIFLAIQIPGIAIAPAVGLLRDHFGARWPTAIGWILQSPLMWFLGAPGKLNLPGLETKSKQEAAFVATTISLGIVAPLSRGGGTFQNTITLREIQDKNPGIFGPHGGSSRLFAMTEVIFNFGLMAGPVLGGALVDTLGFHWMMFGLAILCLISGGASLFYFTDTRMSQTEEV